MRTTTFFIFLLLIAFGSNSQVTKQAMTRFTATSLPDDVLEEEQLFSYDNYGNQIESIDYAYSTTGQIDDGEKITSVYDNNTGNLSEVIVYSYDNATQTWTPTRKESFTQYDSNGNPIEQLVYLYNHVSSQSGWDLYSRYTSSYNSNGLIITKIREHYNYTSQTWTPSSKLSYTYDNTTNLIIEMLLQTWDDTYNTYVNYEKLTYTYDNNQNLLLQLEMEYDTSAGWINSYKVERTYDTSSNRIVSEAFYMFYEGFNRWKGDTKLGFIYDNNDNISTINVYEWDDNVQDWQANPSGIGNATYNNAFSRDNLIINSIYKSEMPYLFNHQLDEILVNMYDATTSTTTPEERLNFYYTAMNILGVADNLLNDNVKIFPNPVQNILQIEGTENLTDYRIFVYDMQGKQILNRVNVNRINVQNLPKGNYIVKILAKEGFKTMKIIKM